MTKDTKKIPTLDLVNLVKKGIEEKKGEEIVTLDIYKINPSICDYFVICHANSNTQVAAIADEVQKMVKGLGYDVPAEFGKINFDYYIQRTSHGSTLSRLVHARLAWEMGMRDTGWELYMDALRSDLVDIQGGTTGEGVHCGVMAGTVYDVLVSYAGLDLSGHIPSLAPELPGHWKGLEFRFTYRGKSFLVSITGQQVKITGENMGRDQIKFHIYGKEVELSGGKSLSLSL